MFVLYLFTGWNKIYQKSYLKQEEVESSFS